MTVEAYQAAAMQPQVVQVRQRHQLKQNVERAICLLNDVAQINGESPLLAKPQLPMKLVVFPEFFLQGWTGQATLDEYRREILIRIPGEETRLLAEACADHQIFLCGGALEHDPDWDDRFFNTAFVIDPQGDMILKYRKFNTALPYDMDTSPHDMLDTAKATAGEDTSMLERLFPVVRTEIGALGVFVCMDGHFPEVTRALALNGAEILLRPTAMPEPLVSRGVWRAENQVRAFENTAYVVAPTIGRVLSDELPDMTWPGGAMISDYRGVVLSATDYPGEGYCTATVHLEELRRQRMMEERNFLPLLRTELWAEMYNQSIYPANKYVDRSPPDSHRHLPERFPYDAIRRLVARRVFTKPRDYVEG